MHDTLAHSAPPGAPAARRVLCGLCWALPGISCTVSGPPRDHLARGIAAVRLGLVSRDELAGIVGALTVIADHVVILSAERAAVSDHAFIRPGQAARDAAAAVLADFRCEVDAFCDDDTCTAPEPDAIAWALRLAAELRSVLASLDAQDGAQ